MSSYEMLNKISSPYDLKKYKIEELEPLCAEIRQKLIETVSANGGHLSPNLGVVELSVALHYTFNSPKDSIVWDVGHQSYTHKMLTGRFSEIDTIRQKGGLSGFPKRSESEHDAFNAGHSSTSISAAYGIAKAKEMLGDDSYTIAVIGDGSFSGGLAYEGCNNAGRFNKNFIVILNDNKMSISKNVGAMARYLTSIRVRPGYLRAKKHVVNLLDRLPIAGDPINRFLKRVKYRLKKLIYKDTLFDYLGFTYYGPVDGHDLNELYNALNAAKKVNSPVLLHVITTKGKGYQYAEEDPKSFHGIGKFDIDSGEAKNRSVSFSDVFGEQLCLLAAENEKICAITAAMTLGTGLSKFSETYKKRFFDVGIAEEHAVVFGCGLAVKGFVPVFAVYSTFLQRSYDQLIHDCAQQRIHMVLAVDRAGIVGEDGETHQGLFDVSMLNSVPHSTVYSPCYYDGLRTALDRAVNVDSDLCAVRFPRGCEGERPKGYEYENINYDIYGPKESKTLIVTYGRLFTNAVKAIEKLKSRGIDACILKLCRIKPIDAEALKFALGFDNVFFFEEGILSGGTAELFAYSLESRGFKGNIRIKAVDDIFVEQASYNQAVSALGFDSDSMANTVEENIQRVQ